MTASMACNLNANNGYCFILDEVDDMLQHSLVKLSNENNAISGLMKFFKDAVFGFSATMNKYWVDIIDASGLGKIEHIFKFKASYEILNEFAKEDVHWDVF